MENIGFTVPEILLPEKGVDLSKWAVVACDQFSSEPAYWDSVAHFVGDAPSTLKLTYPEAYLESGQGDSCPAGQHFLTQPCRNLQCLL